MSIDFPLSGTAARLSAWVEAWDPHSDLALLKAIDPLPAEVVPASLRLENSLWGHQIQAFGFPDGYPKGTWAQSILRGPNTSGWLEIVDPQLTGYSVQRGFSGGPVWDADIGAPIGIIVAADRNAGLRVSYLIPSQKIADVWSDLLSEDIRRGPQPELRKRVPLLLSYQANRRPQEEALRDLCSLFHPGFPSPLLTIIHGDEMQAHDMFLLRLATEIIPRLLSIDKSTTPIMRVQLPWPTHLRKLSHLSGKLEQVMAERVLNSSTATCEDVQKALAQYGTPVIIEMHLHTDDWIRHKNGLLQANLEFWNDWPALAPGQRLFIMLSLTHRTPKPNWSQRLLCVLHKRRILAQIANCDFHRYDRLIAGVLPELADVTRIEAEDWARREAYPYCGGDLTVLVSRIRRLFDRFDALPMERLAQDLRAILTTSLTD